MKTTISQAFDKAIDALAGAKLDVLGALRIIDPSEDDNGAVSAYLQNVVGMLDDVLSRIAGVGSTPMTQSARIDAYGKASDEFDKIKNRPIGSCTPYELRKGIELIQQMMFLAKAMAKHDKKGLDKFN